LSPSLLQEGDRDGIFPKNPMFLVFSPDIRPNIEYLIVTNTDPHKIYFLYFTAFTNFTKPGFIAVVLPYHGIIGDRDNWISKTFEKSTVLIKEFNCSKSEPCINSNNQEGFEFQLDEKIDKKQSFHHRVLFKFQNSAPGNPEYDYILNFNKNNEHPELGFANLLSPEVKIILDVDSDNIDTAPDSIPGSFSDKNIQRIWTIVDDITFQIDFEIPAERKAEFEYILIMAISGAAISFMSIGIPLIFRFKKSTADSSTSSFLKEKQKRDEYAKHIKTLMDKINEQKNQHPDYRFYDAIKALSTEKKMILQHMFTYTQTGLDTGFLYNWYKTIQVSFNQIEQTEKKIEEKILEMEEEIRNLEFSRPPSDNWLQLKDFHDATGIPHENLLENVLEKTFPSKKKITQSLHKEFPIEWIESAKEWRIGDKNNRFAGSKKEENIIKLSNCIKKFTEEINKLVWDFQSERKLIQEILVDYGFEKMFAEICQSPEHGHPSFGACYRCLENVTDGNEKQYKRVFKNAQKSDYHLWDESMWEKKLVKSL